ncbi:MAG: hypothetical protein LDL41_19840, partial [Coleofasciculus sp. S288]|nr:hypothetical protein [Coleofasciculus sp. S288]
TLPFIAVAIQEGNKRFTQEIDQRLAPKYILQRNQVMEFIGAAYNNLCEYQFTNRKNIQEFEEFIRKYLEEFIDVFLDDSKVNYRACLYWLDKNQDNLLFFTGYSTLTAQYTKESLPKEGSLAGYALENSFVVHFYPISPTMSSLPFFHKTRDKRYKSVAVCTVKHPTINNNFFPKMTLCVDCIHEQAKAFGDIDYISKVIVLLSIIFANALTLMDINDEAIRKYIESR